MENGPCPYCWLISQVTLNFHAKTTDDSSSISMAFVAETDSLYASDIICLTNRRADRKKHCTSKTAREPDNIRRKIPWKTQRIVQHLNGFVCNMKKAHYLSHGKRHGIEKITRKKLSTKLESQRVNNKMANNQAEWETAHHSLFIKMKLPVWNSLFCEF